MSVGKAMAATCLHMLIDRGLVDLDAPVARYWPEFAAKGKEGLLVRWVLDHRSGLPFLTDDLWPGAMYDWEAMTKALAAQAPIWPPGTQPAYHIRTFGFLVGEIIRRVTGKRFGAFYRDEIAAPLDIDFHFGLEPSQSPRCAEFIARAEQTPQDPELDVRARWSAVAGAARLQRRCFSPRRNSVLERPRQCYARRCAVLFDPRQ